MIELLSLEFFLLPLFCFRVFIWKSFSCSSFFNYDKSVFVSDILLVRNLFFVSYFWISLSLFTRWVLILLTCSLSFLSMASLILAFYQTIFSSSNACYFLFILIYFSSLSRSWPVFSIIIIRFLASNDYFMVLIEAWSRMAWKAEYFVMKSYLLTVFATFIRCPSSLVNTSWYLVIMLIVSRCRIYALNEK